MSGPGGRHSGAVAAALGRRFGMTNRRALGGPRSSWSSDAGSFPSRWSRVVLRIDAQTRIASRTLMIWRRRDSRQPLLPNRASFRAIGDTLSAFVGTVRTYVRSHARSLSLCVTIGNEIACNHESRRVVFGVRTPLWGGVAHRFHRWPHRVRFETASTGIQIRGSEDLSWLRSPDICMKTTK